MKVYNQAKTEELKEYDLAKGYLREDVRVTEYPEVSAKVRATHYEVVAEYPNGGKDVREIVDEEGVAFRPARTVKESVYVYMPYSEQELAIKEREMRISELKGNLFASDYQAIKYAEGWFFEEDYAPIKAKRASWREEINRIETEISSLKIGKN